MRLVLIALAVLAFVESPLHAEDVSMHEGMEQVDDAYKTLGRGLRRPDPADHDKYLAAIQSMQLNLVRTKDLEPKTATSPEAVTEYRKLMAETLLIAVKMEQALLDKDYAKADELFDGLKELKSKGHDQFKD
ncbi:MAG: hypothetical protein ACOCXA_03905 [Planctomycetota bacterium]